MNLNSNTTLGPINTMPGDCEGRLVHRCCTCGWEWIHGQSGEHSCGSVLREKYNRLWEAYSRLLKEEE
jgi:hypothetical protein